MGIVINKNGNSNHAERDQPGSACAARRVQRRRRVSRRKRSLSRPASPDYNYHYYSNYYCILQWYYYSGCRGGRGRSAGPHPLIIIRIIIIIIIINYNSIIIRVSRRKRSLSRPASPVAAGQSREHADGRGKARQGKPGRSGRRGKGAGTARPWQRAGPGVAPGRPASRTETAPRPTPG